MEAVSNSFALFLSGLLLTFEIANRQSLRQFYGGGYKIVTLVEGNFRELDDVTYLFWLVQVIDNKIGLSLDRMFKYSYQNDVLIIRTEDLIPSENTKGSISTNSFVSLVPRVYRDISKGGIRSFTVPQINQGLRVITSSHRIEYKERTFLHAFIIP